MKKKSALVCGVLLAVAGGLKAADVFCEWNSGESKPDALADGAVAFTYDGSGAILSMTATPSGGGTVFIDGDSMDFAADAEIILAAGGRLVISNAMNCAGDLFVTGLVATATRSWNDGVASTLDDPTQALLATNSWTVMFENMDLDEWEPVEFHGDIPANIGAGWYFPNYFKAEYFKRRTVAGEKRMLVDLMADSGSWTKAVRVLLRQNGANVEGMAVDARYASRSFGGMCVEEAALERDKPLNLYSGGVAVPGSPNGGKGGYGVSQMTMRRVSPEAVCVLAGTVSVPAENAISVAADIHLEGVIGAVTTPSIAATPASTPNFHVDGILTLAGGTTNSYLRGRISGGGTVIVEGRDEVKKVDKTGVAVPPDQESNLETYIRSKNADIRNMNARQLYTLTNAVAHFWGKGIYPDKPVATLYNLSDITATTTFYQRTGQIQGTYGGYFYCVYVVFTYASDNNIKVMATEGYKVANDSSYYEGMDFDSVKSSATEINVVNTYNGDGVAVRSPQFYFSEPRCGILSNKGFDNAMSGSPRFIVRGSQGRSQMYDAAYTNAIPSCGKLFVEDGGHLQMLTNGVYISGPKGYNGGECPIYVREGGYFALGGKNPFGLNQRVVVDGGEFHVYPIYNFQYQSGPYIQRLTLKDGGRVRGAGLMMGIRGSSEQYPYIKVCGDKPCTMDSMLTLQGQSKNEARVFDWRVADVTGDGEPDLIMNGSIRNFYFGTGDNLLCTNVTIRKYGAGTILAKGQQGQAGTMQIYNGEYRLGASGIGYGTYDGVDVHNVYTLCGGRLGAADCTSNELGPLGVKSDSGSIVLGEGATLSFADTSAIEWTGSGIIEIECDGLLGEGRLRFGTSSAGLAPQQIARLRHSGHHVALTDAGWCVDRKTFSVIIR